eukprot:TRINITY_DN74531_c0_g1_i1.p1 TRINITY_DN74531_c0_g1~~TRINITY_DN74531_c0_g1_i1.p1  ORF type:complete len:361 (+),score=58.14 TRINITY_DN74531_c0_g1_i1:59-1084(+)
MQPGKAGFFLTLFVYVKLQGSRLPCFSQRNRNYSTREKTGFGLHRSAAATAPAAYTPTSKERKLIMHIVEAGKAGNWQQAKGVFRGYLGRAPQIYSAILTAAFRCGEYAEGSELYNDMQYLGMPKYSPLYTMGIKLAAKSGLFDAVKSIWREVKKSGVVTDMKLIAARLEAAAEQGDMDTAARLLDFMSASRISPEVYHYDTAIRSCQKSEPPSYRVAQIFLQAMFNSSVAPTVVTFGNLVKAHRQAPLHKLQAVLSQMEELGVQMDAVFVKQYLQSLLYLPSSSWNTLDTLPARAWALRNFSDARLLEAKVFIEKARANGVDFLPFPVKLERALSTMRIS